jgi:hypothetical protein
MRTTRDELSEFTNTTFVEITEANNSLVPQSSYLSEQTGYHSLWQEIASHQSICLANWGSAFAPASQISCLGIRLSLVEFPAAAER